MASGSWAAWTSAVLTGGGLGAAVYQLRMGRKDQRQAREAAAADERARRASLAGMIGLTVSVGRLQVDAMRAVEFVALNSSPYPISNLVAVIATDTEPTQLVLGAILPGDRVNHVEDVERTDGAFGEMNSGVPLLFTDVFGQHWARTPEL